jgi:hypothetical protein
MSTVKNARRAATIQLHTIARPHFKYPPLTRFAWTLPTVIEWEPWEGMVTNRREDRLWGKLIVPSAVVFVVLPNESDIDLRKFRLDLQRLTRATWYLDETNLASLFVIAVRLSLHVVSFDPVTNVGSSCDLPWDYEIPEGWKAYDRPP